MAKSRDAFRTISEVSEWLDTPAHVLRFWESKFTQIRPVKRAGGRRYYRPDDMALLAGIKHLLYDQGLTIKGAQKLLREKGVAYVSALAPSSAASAEPTPEAPEIAPIEIVAPSEVKEPTAPAATAAPAKPIKAPAKTEVPSNVVRLQPERDADQPGLFDLLEPSEVAPEQHEATDMPPAECGVLGLCALSTRAEIARNAKALGPLLARLEQAAAARHG